MNIEQDKSEEGVIDLGSATAETHGSNSGFVPDAPQTRIQLGILAD
jgi:hypothetical protein